MEDLLDVRHVFHLYCRDEEQLIQRLRKRALHDNRLDDASEVVIRRRLDTYELETEPVLEFYREKVTTIDAMQAPLTVINEITSVICNLARPSPRDKTHESAVPERPANLVPS